VAKNKKQPAAGIFLFILLMLAVTVLVIRYKNRPKFVRYPAFGIDIPVNYGIHGIDVSHHQATINWKDVKEMQIKDIKIGFAFIKATEGTDSKDWQFKRNWQQAYEHGVVRGAYHFFNAGKSGKAQAQNFISAVSLKSGDMPPVLDVEQTNRASKQALQQRVADWLRLVENYYGVKPVIYSNADFYLKYLAGKFDDYPLWVAHYFVKNKPRVSRNWVFWQHNEGGRVNGIDAYVDFNVFNGDSADFKNLLIK
jgi:lysozyme